MDVGVQEEGIREAVGRARVNCEVVAREAHPLPRGALELERP